MPVLSPDQFADFTLTTVAGGAGGLGTALNASDTSLILPSGVGNALYPSTFPFMVLIGSNASLSSGELVKCTARTSDTLTIVRAQESTIAETWLVGTAVQQVLTSGNMANLWKRIGYTMAYNVQDYGAVGDGITDDTTAINNCLTAAGANGSTVVFPGELTYLISGMLTLPNYVRVQAYGATIKWGGSTNSVMVGTASTTVLINAEWYGGILDANSTSGVNCLFPQSPQHCHFQDIELRNGTGSGTAAFRLDATGTNGVDATNGNNSCNNTLSHITIHDFPVGLRLFGATTPGDTFCTDNQYYALKMYRISQKGISIVQWSDNNYFYGTLISLNTNSALGIVFNDSATPSSDVGIYADNFYGLGIDAFSISSVTQVTMNNCKQCEIFGWQWSPAPSFTSGTIFSDTAAQSYQLEYSSAAVPYTALKNWRQQLTGTAPGLGTLQTGVSSQTLGVSPQGCTDRAGLVQITTTGSPPGAGAAVVIIDFATAFANAPLVLLNNFDPANSTAAQVHFSCSATASALTISTSTALAASTSYNIVWLALGI